MVSAFAEALENEWEANGMCQAKFVRLAQDSPNDRVGQILRHKLDRTGLNKGIIFKILQILYLDDGAFVFESRNDLIKGVNVINSLFKRIGMEMHVGKNGKDLKTECIWFPAPGGLDQEAITGENAHP